VQWRGPKAWTRKVPIEGADLHPDFLCPDCLWALTVQQPHEFHWLKCLCAGGTFVDPEAGPSEDGLVEIIVDCDLFEEDPTNG